MVSRRLFNLLDQIGSQTTEGNGVERVVVLGISRMEELEQPVITKLHTKTTIESLLMKFLYDQRVEARGAPGLDALSVPLVFRWRPWNG